MRCISTPPRSVNKCPAGHRDAEYADHIAPRIDYQLSTNNTLVGRFEYGWNSRENTRHRRLSPPPPFADMGYPSTGNNQNLMLTETAILTPTR